MNAVRLTGHGAMEALSAFVRDAAAFVHANYSLFALLVVLAIVFFRGTRPRVH